MNLLSFWYATALAFFTVWAAAPILVKYRNGTLDLFEPSIAFRGLLWLYSAPRCVLYLLGVSSYLPFAASRDGIALTFTPLLLTILALAAFDCGYTIVRCRSPQHFVRTVLQPDKRQFYLALGVTVTVLASLAHVYEISRFGFGNFFQRMHEFRDVGRLGSGPLQVLKETLGIGLALIVLSAKSHRQAIIWILSTLPVMVLSGSKFALVLYFFPALVFLRYTDLLELRHARSLRGMAAAVGALLALALSVGFMTLYRQNAALLRAIDWTSPSALAVLFQYSLRAFTRFHSFEVFGLVLEDYRTLGLWAHGDWVLDILRQFVPRDIWPDKPLLMTTTVTPFVRFVDGANHFYPPFVVGFFLFDFAIPGLVFFMFAGGGLAARFYHHLVLTASGVYARLIYGFGIYLLLGVVDGAVAHAGAKLIYTSALLGALSLFYLHIVPQALSKTTAPEDPRTPKSTRSHANPVHG